MSKEIHKKISRQYFQKILDGSKTFELRLADWECQEGDTLVLEKVDGPTKKPTGRTIRKKIGYVLMTKNLHLFTEDDVNRYGYQVISLLEDSAS